MVVSSQVLLDYCLVSHSELYFLFSGIPQGKLIKRQRLPKNDLGEYWHWKDLNLGINVTFYGKVFHLYDCDAWTKVQTNYNDNNI